jgi:hypothetical protein
LCKVTVSSGSLPTTSRRCRVRRSLRDRIGGVARSAAGGGSVSPQLSNSQRARAHGWKHRREHRTSSSSSHHFSSHSLDYFSACKADSRFRTCSLCLCLCLITFSGSLSFARACAIFHCSPLRAHGLVRPAALLAIEIPRQGWALAHTHIHTQALATTRHARRHDRAALEAAISPFQMKTRNSHTFHTDLALRAWSAVGLLPQCREFTK